MHIHRCGCRASRTHAVPRVAPILPPQFALANRGIAAFEGAHADDVREDARVVAADTSVVLSTAGTLAAHPLSGVAPPQQHWQLHSDSLLLRQLQLRRRWQPMREAPDDAPPRRTSAAVVWAAQVHQVVEEVAWTVVAQCV